MPRLINIVGELQGFTFLIRDIFVNIGSVKDNWQETIQEMYLIGAKAFPIIFLGGLFTGIILAIETGHQLKLSVQLH